jgi:putative photosynthetic complex assembly protein 2
MRYFCPVAYTLLVWWASTGLIVYLDGLPRRTFRWSLLGATVLLGAALFVLRASAADTSTLGAYLSFTAGVLAWGWLEVGFLMGPLTGPWKRPCPPECHGWQRVGLAIRAILYHELAIIALGGIVAALTWDGGNRVGLWTFAVLWVMRLSAKLNVFLGVRNLGESFLPAHLAYMASFFRRRPMNLLFPLCVTAATVATALLVQRATADGASEFEAAGITFVATMLGLAVLEHWLLVIPLPETALWQWSLASHAEPAKPPALTATAVLAAAPQARAINMPAQGRWR